MAVPSTCKHRVWSEIDRSRIESKNGMTIGWLMQIMIYGGGKHKTSSKETCKGDRVLLESRMRFFNDDELHKDPFNISSEDMVDAAPVFNVIDIDEE